MNFLQAKQFLIVIFIFKNNLIKTRKSKVLSEKMYIKFQYISFQSIFQRRNIFNKFKSIIKFFKNLYDMIDHTFCKKNNRKLTWNSKYLIWIKAKKIIYKKKTKKKCLQQVKFFVIDCETYFYSARIFSFKIVIACGNRFVRQLTLAKKVMIFYFELFLTRFPIFSFYFPIRVNATFRGSLFFLFSLRVFGWFDCQQRTYVKRSQSQNVLRTRRNERGDFIQCTYIITYTLFECVFGNV